MQLRCARRGFSLIELLIVLVIIGLLAALTLPSLAMARASARRISCASNQRQLGLACQMYADNHDGTVLMNYTPTASGAYATWDLTLLPYALNGKTPTSVFGNPLSQIPRPISIFACPASDDPATPDEVSDYAKNNAFSRAPQGTPPGAQPDVPIQNLSDAPPLSEGLPGTDVWDKPLLKQWQVQKPGQTFFVSDSATHDLDLFVPSTAIGRHSKHISEEDSGTLNILYCDGHVSATDKSEMDWGMETSGPWLPYPEY